MGWAYQLADYTRYRERVGAATYVDITRRADPARVPMVWDNLREILDTHGPPWIVQIWTKDIAGTLQQGGGLIRRLIDAGTTLTAQVTVTGLAGTPWEPRVPVEGFRPLPRLAALIGGAEHIVWRYDPIIPTVHVAARFRTLARQAADCGIVRGVINFIAPPGRYKRVDRRLAALLPAWAEGMPGYDRVWRETTARELVEMAGEVGIAMACCAESADLAERVSGLRPAACGEYAWFVALSGRTPPQTPFRGSRKGCGCVRYFDVGQYGQWFHCHRCAYCYAG